MAFTRQHFGIKHHIAFCSIWNVHCRPDLVSIPAGLSMVIFEGRLSHKFLHHKMDQTHIDEAPGVTLGFAKAAAATFFNFRYSYRTIIERFDIIISSLFRDLFSVELLTWALAFQR